MHRGWHKADIKAAVEKRGSTLTDVALNAGLAEHACRKALRERHRAAEEALSSYLGIPLWELWPDRWAQSACGTKALRIDNRTRAHRHKLKNHIRHGRAGHRQNAARQ